MSDEPDSPVARMRIAARRAIFRAGISIGKFVARRDGKPADLLGEYGKAYARALLFRKQLGRLGHEAQCASMSSEVRRILATAPTLDFASNPKPTLDTTDPDHDPEQE